MAKAINTKAELETELKRRVRVGLTKATKTLANYVRTALSVAAPRGLFKTRSGQNQYLALERATAGAVPRKLSGTFRSTVTDAVVEVGGQLEGHVGSNAVQAKPLEFGYTAKAGTWFPIPASAALARHQAKFQTRAKGKSLKLKSGEVRWIKRKTDKWIAPHPVFYPMLHQHEAELREIIAREVNK